MKKHLNNKILNHFDAHRQPLLPALSKSDLVTAVLLGLFLAVIFWESLS